MFQILVVPSRANNVHDTLQHRAQLRQEMRGPEYLWVRLWSMHEGPLSTNQVMASTELGSSLVPF